MDHSKQYPVIHDSQADGPVEGHGGVAVVLRAVGRGRGVLWPARGSGASLLRRHVVNRRRAANPVPRRGFYLYNGL